MNKSPVPSKDADFSDGAGSCRGPILQVRMKGAGTDVAQEMGTRRTCHEESSKLERSMAKCILNTVQSLELPLL